MLPAVSGSSKKKLKIVACGKHGAAIESKLASEAVPDAQLDICNSKSSPGVEASNLECKRAFYIQVLRAIRDLGLLGRKIKKLLNPAKKD